MPIFAKLEICRDATPRAAAVNMAIDEALLETAKVPSIRFYRWNSPALSFGYFGKFADVANYAPRRDLVRRWTGGGIVFHGDDLTYSIVIPANDPAFSESSMLIYEKIHCALCSALLANGERAELAPVAGVVDAGAAIIDHGYSCFANPVRADVMVNGRKVAGAAQRRTRAGLRKPAAARTSLRGLWVRGPRAGDPERHDGARFERRAPRARHPAGRPPLRAISHRPPREVYARIAGQNRPERALFPRRLNGQNPAGS